MPVSAPRVRTHAQQSGHVGVSLLNTDLVTRNSGRNKRNRAIKQADGVPYSVARRRAVAGAAPFPTPDFAALVGDEPD
jgi:hypothetical protein